MLVLFLFHWGPNPSIPNPDKPEKSLRLGFFHSMSESSLTWTFDVGRSMFNVHFFPSLECPHPLRSEAYISLQRAVYLVEGNLLSLW